MNKIAILTFGKTHSGKTTFAKLLREKITYKSVIIDNDAFRKFLVENYSDYYLNDTVKANRTASNPDLSLKLSRVIFEESMKEEFIPIFAVAHSSKIIRDEHISLIKKYGYKSIIVQFNYSKEYLLERIKNASRDSSFLTAEKDYTEALERQFKEFEEPEKTESDFSLEISNESHIDKIIQEIIKIIN